MKHIVKFLPAWDRTDPDPKKNYGISDVEIRFWVIGDKGIVEYQLGTGWHLPHVVDRRLEAMKHNVYIGKEDFLLRRWSSPAFSYDICYYSPVRVSEDDICWEEGVTIVPVDWKPVFYGYRYEPEENGKYTTDYVYEKFLTDGEDFLWKYLEDYYVAVFGADND